MGTASESVALEKDAPSRTRQVSNSGLSVDLVSETRTHSRIESAAAESPSAAAQLISQTGPNVAVLQRAQRSFGNRASQQILMRARAIQRKCDCGGTCDKCQQQEEQPVLQRSAADHHSPVFTGTPSSQGEPLAAEALHPLESHFQSDLSDVRVHTNTEAAESATALDAHAFTTGRDIYFADGMYAPATTQGQRLLAHEVAHVVQQSSGKEPAVAMKSAHGVKIGAPDDILETEADQAAETFLRQDGSQSIESGQNLSQLPATESETILRQPAPTTAPVDQTTTQDTASAIADALLKDDTTTVVTLLRKRSIAELVSLRTAVHAKTNVYLERWFITKELAVDQQKKSRELGLLTSVVNPTAGLANLLGTAVADESKKSKVNEGPLAEEGLRWLWYALPLIDRLEIYDEGYREIEQAQLDTIKHASDQEKAEAKKESKRLEAVYDKMDAKEEYDARTMIDPTPDGLLEAVNKLLNQADDVFWKHKDLLYTAVLALAPAVRSQFFDQHETKLQAILWHNDLRDEFSLLKSMAHADEAAALIARLRLATEDRSDDMEAVQAVVDRAVALLGEKRGLVASQSDPHLSAADRETINKRLREIGDVESLLQMQRVKKGKLDPKSFMGMISAARDDPYSFGVDAQRLAAFAPEVTGLPGPETFLFQTAKQRLLLAGDDFEAITHTFLTIHAPHVQGAPGATAISNEIAQDQADVDFRNALLADPDVHHLVTSLVTSQQMHVLSAIPGDAFSEKLYQLNQFRITAQWGAFFDLVLQIAQRDDWRARYNATSSDPFGVFAGTFDEEREIMLEILRTRHMPLIALLTYTGNVATLQTAFANISKDDRERLREGWAISRNLVMGPLTAEQQKAKDVFLEFETKVRDKLGKSSDFEDVLSAGLGSIPTMKEVSTPESRYQAAALMYERIEARLALDRGLSAEFTETDETMVAAGRQFVALWLHVRDLHALTFVDFATLAELNDTFLSRSKEFAEASRAITDLAATIAATVAGLVVVAATGGAATPAVIALAAAAGAGTGIVTREMFGGDYYRIGSDEALKGALMDSINGALAVVSGGLAAKGTELIGLGGKTLVAGAARAAGTVAEEASVSFSQKLAASAVESAIDGFFSGAVSQGFDTLLDDRTWRKGIWAGLLQAGRAAIAAGLTGLATGGVLGPATHIAGAGLSKISKAIFNQGLDKALARAGASELLTAAREAAERGETAEVARLMNQMEAHLSDEEANLLRQDLNAQLREKFGHPPGTAKPSTPQQQDLLRQSGLKDSGSALSKEELDAEHFIVENSEPQISTEPGYVDEVDLGNGHTWRRAEDNTWCRFTTKSLCQTPLKAKPMSPEAAARARRFEWEQRQVRSAQAELGGIKRDAALEKHDLDEFEKLLEQVRENARNGRKFRFKDLTKDQQSVIEQMFPNAELHELEALDYPALERRGVQGLGTKDAPGAVTRLEQRIPVLDAALTTAKQPLATRLRSVPADIERNIRRRAGGLDEFAKLKPVSGRLSIEHVYPLSKIMAMKGFFELEEAEMRILASWERNLRMTDLEANILRKERSYSELSSLEFGKYYAPQGLEAAAKLERQMELELQKELDRMLAAKPSSKLIQRSPAGRGQSSPFHSIAPPDDGQMLPASLRIALESHFRMDLSGIRIHADASAAESAQSLDSHAYATGRDIYFAPGMYAPTTDAGKRLLVHEVAHVIQQGSGKEPTVATKSTRGAKIGAADDILETEADHAADVLLHKDAPYTEDEKRTRSLSSSGSIPTILRQPASVEVAPADLSAQDIVHAQLAPLFSQNQQSNRESMRVIQRQPVPDQSPIPEAGISTISAEDAQSVLRDRISLALARCAWPPADVLSFVDQVKFEAQAGLVAKLHDEELTTIVTRADQLRGVGAEVAKESFDYVSALQLIVRVLGFPPDTGVPKPSYGTAAYIRQVSSDISGYLVIPLYTVPPFYLAHTAEILSAWFGILLQQLGDPKNYLRLELEGSLQRLVELRASFEKAKTPADAANFGQAIGETARRVLLLNDALGQMEDNAFDPASPLEDRLAGIAPQVDQIRSAAQQEKTTLTALGDVPGLLKPREIPVDLTILSEVDPTSIAPEEAFPQASDRATEELLSELDARVLARATTADQLRSQIIPTSPSYDLLEFATVYRRWFAFFSPAARDMDPFYVQMRDLYRRIYSAEGMAGIEGGFGRALLMRSISNYVSGSLGEASTDFASDVSELNLRRRENVTGTAQNPRYEFGELFAPDSADLSASGEDTSRSTALGAKTASSRESMEMAQFLVAKTEVPAAVAAQSTGLIPTARNSVVVFHDVTAKDTWNYLLRTHSMTPDFQDINIYEQKEMPPEIARYLLAQQQLQMTLQQSHKPGFGDTAAALGGVEEGRAVGTQRYLRGEDRDTTNPRAESDKASIANVARKYGVERDAKAQNVPGPTDALLRDLEGYLNQFFAAQTEPAQRIAAVLLIAQLEHNVGKQFTRYFTGEELKKAIAFVLALTGIKALLGRFGPIGEAISMALDQGLQLMGVTPGAAMVALLAWLVDTGQTSTFSEARVQAFFAFDIIDDLGQLAQQYAIQGAVAGIHLAAMRGPEPKNLAELANRFEPILQDPRVHDAFLKRVDSEIAIREEKGGGRDFSDPELDQLRSLAAHLREQSVANAPDAADIPLRPTPIEGGTRGVDVYRLAGSTIGRNRVMVEVDVLAGRTFLDGGSLARVGPEHSGTYQLTVGETKVPLTIDTVSDAVFSAGTASAHQGQGGPVRFVLQRDAITAQWTAKIQVHERVLKEDVQFLVGHELDEISSLVANHPSATPEVVARETQASMFAPASTSDIVTAHDRAAARELAELAENIELRKGKLSPDLAAIRDEQARLDRMLRAMGLDQGFTPADPRVQVLRDAGVPGSVMMDINNGAVGKRYAQNLREPVKPADILGAEPTMVGRPGHARSKHEITKDQQANVLNNFDKVYSGVNESGRHVDVYWKGDQLVITDAGMKQRVITSYQHDFKTWTSANPNMKRIK